MDKIFGIMSEHNQYIMISIYIIIAAVIVTFVVNFATNSLKFAKYFPGMLLICVGMFSLFSVMGDLFNPENLDNIVVFVIACAAGIVSFLFALILGIIQND